MANEAKSLAIELLEQENARLHIHIHNLLQANNAYLERARKAERELAALKVGRTTFDND